MGILFNSTALGIHFCETSLIFNFKTRLGGEICLCDVNMHKGYCMIEITVLIPSTFVLSFNLVGFLFSRVWEFARCVQFGIWVLQHSMLLQASVCCYLCYRKA